MPKDHFGPNVPAGSGPATSRAQAQKKKRVNSVRGMKVLARNLSPCPLPSCTVSIHSKGFAQKLSPIISATISSADHGSDLGSDAPFNFMASSGGMGGGVDQFVEEVDARPGTKGRAEAGRTGPVVGLDGSFEARPEAHEVSALHQGGSSFEANPANQSTLNPEAEVGNVGTWKGSSEGGDDEDKMESEEGGGAALPLH